MGWPHLPANRPERRRLMIASAGLGLGLAGLALGAAGARAQPAAASAMGPDTAPSLLDSPALRAAFSRFAGGAVVEEGGVHLDLPELVENGHAVPVTVRVDSPMTATDHVVAIALFAGRNPLPEVAEFQLGPANGRAQVSTRMRLATSQRVVAAARMADGRVRTRHLDVLVTLAACVES